MEQGTIKIKLPKPSEITRRHKKEADMGKKIKKEENMKRDFIRRRMVFRVKKMTSVISGVFNRKKTLSGENREQRDGSEGDETVFVKLKQNPIQKKGSFWESARIRLKTLILGQRLKRRRNRRRSLSEGMEEEELCKKRILMGERCKPMNGVLQYDGDGILLPEP
ncbi:weak similarity to C. elegans transposase (TR:g1125840) [Arabidopsis thaliana]|uniref:F2P16.13 protein n=2 Tax=Arabidopsis thaliana TaxID=3702 RepID=O04643_ARATH|nr:uncharacterized protein AT5G27020 [Arabidopsis thaliana]AAB61050.1 weak similarity to C. elegans transposase (TR:g1125840) [Arabidopsis thaliana]AAU44560.1 hypothetical protein AT5G27020 [Arabidopsis thaliana]AAX55195.1 hypothetical protein At5g27020 [Arabidopsis thaliana]AED93641.1 hypothetical protein AT5G27020 [Arabidopsis thaliana]VYS68045.1 unnamed protein product [Arabidopsis thaliana]|eukprot:NP_198054.1 hypothetical protein AT5G27020 [Arabidopsis thaliana]